MKKEGIIYRGFTGEINPTSATNIAATFADDVEEGYAEIHLCLNSQGGTTDDGIYLHKLIAGLPVKTTIYNLGMVASAAMAVYLAADTRLCSKHGAFLWHQSEMPVRKEAMDAHALHAAFSTALLADQRMNDLLLEKAPNVVKELQSRGGTAHLITPEDAVKFGLADGIAEFDLPSDGEIGQISDRQ